MLRAEVAKGQCLVCLFAPGLQLLEKVCMVAADEAPFALLQEPVKFSGLIPLHLRIWRFAKFQKVLIPLI